MVCGTNIPVLDRWQVSGAPWPVNLASLVASGLGVKPYLKKEAPSWE